MGKENQDHKVDGELWLSQNSFLTGSQSDHNRTQSKNKEQRLRVLFSTECIIGMVKGDLKWSAAIELWN